MLRRFFEIEVNDQGVELPDEQKINKKLFIGGEVAVGNTKKNLQKLKIAAHEDIVKRYLGKFPVLHFSFKGVFDVDLKKTKAFLAAKLKDLFTIKFSYLEKYSSSAGSENPLGAEMKPFFDMKTYPNVDLCRAFYLLCSALKEHFKQRVVLLIDDYDEPIQYALQKYNESEAQQPYIDLIAQMLGSVLDRVNIDVIERSYLTGMFPYNEFHMRLTRLQQYTFLDAEFSEYYGFNEHEVKKLLKKTAVSTKLEDLKAWYNGFYFDDLSLYNPVSVMQCLKNKGKLEYYSVLNDTFLDFLGPNALTLQYHRGLQRLCSNKTRYFFHLVSAGIPYPSDIYYFLLFSGYVQVKKYNSSAEHDYDLSMPNFEAVHLYEKFILKLITDQFGFTKGWQKPLASLLGSYKIKEFETALQKVMFTTNFLNRDNVTHEPIANIESYASDGRFYNGLFFSIAYSLPPYFIQISDMGEEYFDRTELILIPSVTSGHKEAIIIKFREMWVVDKYLSTEEHSDSKEVFGEIKEDKSRGIDDYEVNVTQQAEFRVKSMELIKHYPTFKSYPYIEHIHKLYAVFRGNELAIGYRKVANEKQSFTPRYRTTRTTTVTTQHETIETEELPW